MSSTSYITGVIDALTHPPGLGNPFFASGSSVPPTWYNTGGYTLELGQAFPRDRSHSLRTRKPRPYKPSPASSRTLTPGMSTPAEALPAANGHTNGDSSAVAQNGSASPMQQLVQAMSLNLDQPQSARSTGSDENASAASRPTTAESSINGHSSSPTTTTSSINTTPGQVRLRPPRPDAGQPLWTHRLSASFNAMAVQVEAASQAIALIPALPGTDFGVVARVEALENAQARIEESMSDLRELIERGNVRDEGVKEVQKDESTMAESETREEVDVAALKKAVDGLVAKNKLDQQRLPARLHNSIVTTSKGLIKPVIGSNGKLPPQFPTTRGEFFHLTKERYESMMKSYELPISGDVASKRTAVREFIGLPE